MGAIALIAIIGMTQYQDMSISQNTIIEREHDHNIAHLLVKKHIETSPEFVEIQGLTSIINSVEIIEEEECLIYNNDPYGLKIYNPSCYKVTFIFVNSEQYQDLEGYHIEAIVMNERIQKITKQKINSFNDIDERLLYDRSMLDQVKITRPFNDKEKIAGNTTAKENYTRP